MKRGHNLLAISPLGDEKGFRAKGGVDVARDTRKLA